MDWRCLTGLVRLPFSTTVPPPDRIADCNSSCRSGNMPGPSSRQTCPVEPSPVQSSPMSLLGKIDPAIAKRLAEQIRAIGKAAKSETDVRLNGETALKHYLAQLEFPQAALLRKLRVLNTLSAQSPQWKRHN